MSGLSRFFAWAVKNILLLLQIRGIDRVLVQVQGVICRYMEGNIEGKLLYPRIIGQFRFFETEFDQYADISFAVNIIDGKLVVCN